MNTHDWTTRSESAVWNIRAHGVRPYLVMQNMVEEEKIAERMKDYGYRHPGSPRPLKNRLAYLLGGRMIAAGLWLRSVASEMS